MVSKSSTILDIIATNDGMRLIDIQRALWYMTRRDDFDVKETWNPARKRNRGYWCTNLLGGIAYHQGLLKFFCTKGPDGLWRRNDISHNGHPWKTMRKIREMKKS